jgi:chromosome segregation ATPase
MSDAQAERSDRETHSTSAHSSALSIPLPTEVPPPPELSSLPAAVLHTGTIETLLGLNEDLMARLKVNIRRNALLEQQLLDQEEAKAELERNRTNLISQLELMREKEELNRERVSDAQAVKLRLEVVEDKLKVLRNYRRRVLAWVKPSVKRMKALKDTLAQRDAQLSDVRARLQESIAHIQTQEKNFNRDQTKLVEKYEARVTTLEKELEKARPKAARFEDVTAKAAETQNRLIFLERRNEELERRLKEDTAGLSGELAKYRAEAKTLAFERIAMEKDLTHQRAETLRLSEECRRIQDQFESLQTVWADAQNRIELSRAHNKSLNRLNQELSRQLKELQARESSKTRLSPPEATQATTAPAAAAAAPLAAPAKLGKIDALLSEIESELGTEGKSGGQAASDVHSLEIIEKKNETAPEADA